MRKFDCNSFRITGKTNFKKKLTSFLSKSVWGNPAMKVKLNLKFADTQPALKEGLNGVVAFTVIG